MMLSLIVAMTKNRVIGRDNQMPWHLPADLAWFKKNTLGKPVIMGRKTFQSIGRALPNRKNIVLSRQGFQADGIEVVSDLSQALALIKGENEVMIIGGGHLFAETLPIADRLYLTEIDAELQGDTFFPEIDPMVWKTNFIETRAVDDKNSYALTFKILERM
ncbi:dihydrofolate reductase [Gallibacterium genomosp. 2]|uniref:Dihydrofolate reductase n=1 Tax=Gallibacterium genomosp. 2 TaxID=155517 RepID=A0A0A2XQ37_9PAST|nr:type 3 dihydrofolate reductase [Gallibacterium genomosp. 2]KGQ32780.1 dihydrofolate reductase [Gallibacterium genomosp. 2]